MIDDSIARLVIEEPTYKSIFLVAADLETGECRFVRSELRQPYPIRMTGHAGQLFMIYYYVVDAIDIDTGRPNGLIRLQWHQAKHAEPNANPKLAVTDHWHHAWCHWRLVGRC